MALTAKINPNRRRDRRRSQDDALRPDPARPAMVRWFAPRELIRTSIEVLSAHAVAWFVDPRVVFGGRARGPENARAEGKRALRRDDAGVGPNFSEEKEFWFDYVADLGDGWDSTYAIAQTVAAQKLRLSLPAHEPRLSLPAHEPRANESDGWVVTERGRLLVLGGDLVYPTPRADNYRERFVAPYEEATRREWERDKEAPYVLALPGNHDWYDGLRNFRQMFCRPESWFAGWRSYQWRSYFAIPLPHDVWLIGADTQLANSINPDQEDYFRTVAEEIEDHHRVILCLATPDWLEPHAATRSVVDEMEDLLGHEVNVCLAGHRHHYQRHSIIRDERGANDEFVITDEGQVGTTCPQRITAGGGGAYLSPTHVPVHRSLRNRLHRHASFPPPSESRRYRQRLFLFPVLEPWFGTIPAVIYGLGCCLFLGLETDNLPSFLSFLPLAKDRAATLPGILFFVVLGLSTLMLRQRFDAMSFVIAGMHTAAHLAGVFLVAYWVLPWQSTWYFLPVLLAAALGWGVGATIVGVYLWLASSFDRFVDVGYAALRIDDWKSFLRFHLDKRGNLKIYPIGLRRVPRTWSRRNATDRDSALRPEDPRATEPELIEMPISIPAPRKKSTASRKKSGASRKKSGASDGDGAIRPEDQRATEPELMEMLSSIPISRKKE